MDRVRGLLQPARVDVREEDPAGTPRPGEVDVHAADRPGTHHDDVVALTDPGEFLPVDRAGEGLRHRRLRKADALGDPVETVDLQHGVRHDQILGEPAVVLVTHRRLVRADRQPARGAVRALTARDRRDDLDTVTRLPAPLDLRADLDDLTRDLVTHHPRRVQVLVTMVEDLHIRTARRAVTDPDLHLVRLRGGLRHVLYPEITGSVETCDFHAMSLLIDSRS